MTTVRNKVWKKVGNNSYYIPLTRAQQSSTLTTGADDGQLIHAIPYGNNITTQSILDFLIDLVENDKAINNEINGINRIISEGILPSTGFQFGLNFLYVSRVTGVTSMSSGHDWSTVNGKFTISVRAANVNSTGILITLNTNCTTAQQVVDKINAEFALAVVNIGGFVSDYVVASLDSTNKIILTGLLTTDNTHVPTYNGFSLTDFATPNHGLADIGINISGTINYRGNIAQATVNGGSAKLHESYAVYGVYEIDTDTIFDVAAIHTTGWWRRDLINIVFKDTSNPDLVPYLEYVEGEESSVILPRHTLANKSISTSRDTYPLWSLLFKDVAGVFTYVEDDQVFAFGGYSENVKLIHTLAFQRNNNGYYASLHDNVQFTLPDGMPLPLNAGTSSNSVAVDKMTYDLESICSNDPTGKLTLQEPDILFRDDLAHGDSLTFPFRLEELVDEYLVSESVELSQFKIALDDATIAQEGLELHIYTAKYFVDAYNYGIVGLSSITINGATTSLTLDKDIYSFTKLTGNNVDFIIPPVWEAPQVGDFVFVFYGLGLYEISAITAITDGTHIVINSVPITLDTTSKLLIYKANTVTLAGETIDSAFIAAQTYDDKIRYAEQYPFSVETGISALPWYYATYSYKEFGLSLLTTIMPTGLDNTGATTYKIKINIDGLGLIEYSLTPNTTPLAYKYSNLITDLNSALSGLATFEIIGGDLRCTTLTKGPDGSVVFAAGTSNDLFVALGTTYNAKAHQDGVNVESNYAIAKGVLDLSGGHNWNAINQAFSVTIYQGGSIIGPTTITLTQDCLNITDIITHINTQLGGLISDIIAYQYIGNTVAFRTTLQGADQGLKLIDISGALTTLGLSSYDNKKIYGQYPDIDEYYKATGSSTTRLFWHMPAAPGTFEGYPKVTFPFKIKLNYNQWYFARISVRDRNVTYAEYGTRPKIVTLETTWAASNSSSLNGYLATQIMTNQGLYLYQIDGITMFQIQDQYGDITTPMVARTNLGRPASYILTARNLNGSAFIEPTVSGNAYVDVMNGIVTFKNDPAEQPEKLYLTYYYNSIVTGAIWTDHVFHEKQNGEVWNLQMLIEELINPISATSSGSTTAIIDITPYSLDAVGSKTDFDFEAGTVIRYDIGTNPTFGWCKASAANFHYVGDAMVLQRISDTKFQIITLGKIDTIGVLGVGYTANITDFQGNNLTADTIYYLSDTIAGAITKTKPQIAQPILFTFDDNGGNGVTTGLVVLLTKASFLELYNVNHTLTQKCLDLSNQSDQLTKQVMDLATAVSFANNKIAQDSNFIMDTFTSKQQTSLNALVNIAKPAILMDENSYDNNWYESTDNEFMSFKQGALAPRRTTFMSEVINKYDLSSIGLSKKAGIVYDSVNNCYWLMTNGTNDPALTGYNTAGMICQLVLDGVLNLKGYWYLPAPGVTQAWTGIHSDGSYLYFTLNSKAPGGGGGGAESHLFKVIINSNGSLGKAGFSISSGGQLASSLANLTTMSDAHLIDSVATYSFNDVCEGYDSSHLYILALAKTTSNPLLLSLDKATLTVGSVGVDSIIDCALIAGTAAEPFGRSICHTGNYLYIRVDDNTLTTDNKVIYKINVDTDIKYTAPGTKTLKSFSGRFRNAIEQLGQTSLGGNGGVCTDQRGDILEVLCAYQGITPVYTRLVAQHAMADSYWAENQIQRKMILDNPGGGALINYAACIDGNYLWYTSNNGVSDSVYINKKHLTDTTIATQTIQVTGGTWTHIYGLMITNYNGVDYFYFVGYTGAAYVSRVVSRTYLESQFGGSISFSDAVNTASFASYPPANATIFDITADDEYLYLLDRFNKKIWRSSLGSVASPPTVSSHFILLPTTTNYVYSGLAYYDGKFAVARYNSAAAPAIGDILVYSRDLVRDGSNNAYQLHRYELMFTVQHYGAQLSIDAYGTLWQVGGPWSGLDSVPYVIARKILADPDALQLQFFLNSSNILAHDTAVITEIADRYFDPTEFFDIRDCPDKKYAIVYYPIVTATNFSILMLDAFLSGKSSTGQDRYDISKIIKWDFLRGNGNLFHENAGAAPLIIRQAVVERDMIFISYSSGLEYDWNSIPVTGTYFGLFFIDLKAGKSCVFGNLGSTGAVSSSSGLYYAGTISDRNATKGYAGVANADWAFGSATYNDAIHIRQIHARTFSKDDLSDYSLLHDKTYVALSLCKQHAGTQSLGGLYVLVIDWDENGNRSINTLFKDLTKIATFANNGYGSAGCYISTDGQLFYGAYVSPGKIYQYSKPLWEIQKISDEGTGTLSAPSHTLLWTYTSTNQYPYRIEDIVCFKNAAGTWRHQLLVTLSDLGYLFAGRVGAGIIDAENKTFKNIFEYTTADSRTVAYTFAQIFEDKLFLAQGIPYAAVTGDSGIQPFIIAKRMKFDDNSVLNFQNYWSRLNSINSTSSPRFILNGYDGYTGVSTIIAKSMRYCKNESLLFLGTTAGVQGMCFPQSDLCEHESIDFDCEDPKYYFYRANVINNGSN